MNLAVRMHKHAKTHHWAMPGEWPAQVLELKEGEGLPGPEWHSMTVEEYNAHRDKHQHLYDAWHKKFEPHAKWRYHWGIPARVYRVWRKLRGTF